MKFSFDLFLPIPILLTACLAVEHPTGQTIISTAEKAPTGSFSLSSNRANIVLPPVTADWQIQYSGELDYQIDVEVFNLDLFESDTISITNLNGSGIFVMCYFSAGSREEWRPDSSQFPRQVLGNEMRDWPGEKWLDVRQTDVLAPIMEARLDLAVQKGCEGVDPDNVNGYTNDSGFPLSYEDQLTYNKFLAEAAHARGLSIGLKNDLEQIPDLLDHFDWAMNEECFAFDECELLLPFVEAGKPVYVIEYDADRRDFCERANQMNFNALIKNRDLGAFAIPCR